MFGLLGQLVPAVLAATVYGTFKPANEPSGPGLYCTGLDMVYTGFEDVIWTFPEMATCFEVLADGKFGEFWKSRDELSWWQKFWIREVDGWVFPGFWDGHAHLVQYGMMEVGVKAYDQTVPQIITSILNYLEKDPTYGTRSKWVLGTGWDQAYFGGNMPTAEDLISNPLLTNLYIAIYRVDVHCIWVSPAVLRLLPDPLPPTPPGGSIPSDGVFCDNAMDDMIIPLIPEITEEDIENFITTAVSSLHSVGLVGITDAATAMKEVPVYKRLAESGKLDFRVYGMVECTKRNTFCNVDKYHFEDKDGQFTLTSAKIFADGALGSWGAALLEPYSDKPTRGSMLINETKLANVVSQWYAADWQVGVHAIGDAANRAALNAFEIAMELHPHIDGHRKFRIEHAQIIHPDDQIRRMDICNKAGVILENCIIPSIQPTHATSDMSYALSRLGPKRLKESAYRMQSLFPKPKIGVPFPPYPVLGSDFPVEPPSPIEGMYAAITRCSPRHENCEKDAVWDGEKLDRLQAVQGFGRNVGWGMLEGWRQVGQLGGWADWVVLDKSLFDQKVDLRKVKVKETWIGGKRVFKRESEEKQEEQKKQEKPAFEVLDIQTIGALTGLQDLISISHHNHRKFSLAGHSRKYLSNDVLLLTQYISPQLLIYLITRGVGANSPIYSTPPVPAASPVGPNLSIMPRTPRIAFMMSNLNRPCDVTQAPNMLMGAPAVDSTPQTPPQSLIVAQNKHHEVQLPLLRGSNAKSTVFTAYELLENILKYAAPQELHILRRVTTAFDEVIKSSIVIKYITFKLAGIPRSLQEELQFLKYHVAPQNSEVQLHPFMDRLVLQWCFKIPDDVYVTRPPVKTMSLTLNDPNNIRHIIIKSPVAGVTLRHFIRTLARPLIRRYEELIASNQRARFPLPDICASVRFKYPVSGVRNVNNQRNDDNIDLVQYQQDYGAYFITRNQNTYWFWTVNDGEAIPGMGEL
ncbi:hypothetical protein TWF132_007234 [Orbilia oligospora]|nr:hypothetical protein TWF132_007234 [Orbilia oligospora]